jgi:hypothetical protein
MLPLAGLEVPCILPGSEGCLEALPERPKMSPQSAACERTPVPEHPEKRDFPVSQVRRYLEPGPRRPLRVTSPCRQRSEPGPMGASGKRD